MTPREHARKMLVKRNHSLPSKIKTAAHAKKPGRPQIEQTSEVKETQTVTEAEKPVAAKKKATKKDADDTVD